MSPSCLPATGIAFPRISSILRISYRPACLIGKSKCLPIIFWLGFSFSSLIPAVTSAAVWTVEPSIELSTSYTDNVTLAAKGQERDEYVLGVSPGVSVRADGRKLSMLFNYGYEQLFYMNDSSQDYSRQLFQGRADAELVPDLAYVSGSGRVSQQLVDPTGTAGLGELSVTENVGEVSTWTMSPTLRRNMGGLQFSLGMNFDIVDYRARLRDSYSREARVDIGTDGQRQRVTEWQLGVSRREIIFAGDDPDQQYETLSGLLRYHFTSAWSAEARAGYVRNSYVYNPLVAETPEGQTWSAGLFWTPTPRTSVSGGVGEHYFGSTQFANLAHRSRYNTLRYSYVEEISSARQLQVNSENFNVIDENGEIVLDSGTGEPLVVELQILSQTTEVFIAERNKLDWGFRSLHVSFGLGALREQRHLQSSGGTETITGRTAGAGWHPSSRSSFLLSYNEQTVEFVIGREDVFRDIKLEATRRFHPKVSGALQLLRTERESSDSAVTEYLNHVVTARVRLLF